MYVITYPYRDLNKYMGPSGKKNKEATVSCQYHHENQSFKMGAIPM